MKNAKTFRKHLFVILVVGLVLTLPFAFVSAKYTTSMTVADDIKLEVEVTEVYTISSTCMKSALSALSTKPKALKFVTGTSVPAGLACVSGAESGIQAEGSGRIGMFQSEDGETVYVAPMNMSTSAPANNTKAMALESTCANLFDGNSTGLKEVLESLDLSNLSSTAVTNMNNMFCQNQSLNTITFGDSFITTKVEDMSGMFDGCSSLTSVDLTKFETVNVTSMERMFNDCSSLTSLNLKSFNTSKVTDTTSMFKACTNLASIIVSSSFGTTSVTSSANMFDSCTKLVGGNNTAYDPNHTDKTYACIDKAGTPGYFTEAT